MPLIYRCKGIKTIPFCWVYKSLANNPNCDRKLVKTLQEQEKMRVSNIFFFFLHFLLFQNHILLFQVTFFFSANTSILDNSKISSCGREINIPRLICLLSHPSLYLPFSQTVQAHHLEFPLQQTCSF